MHAIQRRDPSNLKLVFKARRRKVCVESILTTARSKRKAEEAAATPSSTAAPLPDCVDVAEGICPISAERLNQFFTAVNTPVGAFNPMASVGASFRTAMDRLPPATVGMALLTDAPSSHEIEDQVQRAWQFKPRPDRCRLRHL
uniref:Uncharacterized protein n=1 Tax=Peronospora matthiolae TaxID=2874970 RepID=A0AAV1V7Y3_9STRA